MTDWPWTDPDTSTPTVKEALLHWQRGGNTRQSPERFNRMIAKVKADALRDFAVDEVDGTAGFPFGRLFDYADEIEENP